MSATRITLGIDNRDNRANNEPSAVARLIRRLRFPHTWIDAVHVLPSFPYTIYNADPALATEALVGAEQDRRVAAQEQVEQEAERLETWLPDAQRVRPVLVEGSPVEGLREYAQESQADLIALGGPHAGPFASLLTGSVARGLVIGARNSLLLAKDFPQESRQSATTPVRVVFATDHSPYANRCLAELLRLAPRGIAHLTVLTVYPQHDLEGMTPFLPKIEVNLPASVRRMLESRNDAVVQQLEPLLNAASATVDSRVVGDPVNEAIAATIQNTDSDLLILGAQGHGLVERVTVGSVSFHQAMTSPYSLLILRP